MARHEADREDLFAEALALTRRIEGRLVATGELIVAGFRAADRLSVYFGPDPMYQVDADGRLRRAFERGLLYRSEGHTLACLRRDRTDTETSLLRYDLSPDELIAFRGRMTDRFKELAASLESYGLEVLRQVPEDDNLLRSDILVRLRTALIVDAWIAPAIKAR